MAALPFPFLFSAPGADSAGLAVRAPQALGRAHMAWLMPPTAEDWGPNLEYTTEFLTLQALLVGRPETQFQTAEPPDWSQVSARSEALLERSRDLRVLM